MHNDLPAMATYGEMEVNRTDMVTFSGFPRTQMCIQGKQNSPKRPDFLLLNEPPLNEFAISTAPYW